MAHGKPQRSTIQDDTTYFDATLTVDFIPIYPILLISTSFYSILSRFILVYSVLSAPICSSLLSSNISYHVRLFYILFVSTLFYNVLLCSFLLPTLSYFVMFYSVRLTLFFFLSKSYLPFISPLALRTYVRFFLHFFPILLIEIP